MPGLLGDSSLAMWISLLQNFQQKTQVWIHVVFLYSSRHFTQEMLVILGSSVERRWWLETPHHSVPGPRGEVKYVSWDRPNVDVICSRAAQEEEELQVEEGQQGRVLHRRDDGGSLGNVALRN